MQNFYFTDDCQFLAKQIKKVNDQERASFKDPAPLQSKSSKIEKVKSEMKSNPNNELIKNLACMREQSQNEHQIIYLSKIIKGLEDGLISLN
jgi:hypothetical protein